MPAKAEWITIEELHRRVPTKSVRTLRRYVAEKRISFRRMKARGTLEFNWSQVQREFACLETEGVNAYRARTADFAIETTPAETALRAEINHLSALVAAIAAKMGIPAPVFTAEQPDARKSA